MKKLFKSKTIKNKEKKSNNDVSNRTIEKESKLYNKSSRWKKFGYLVLNFLKILLFIKEFIELFSWIL